MTRHLVWAVAIVAPCVVVTAAPTVLPNGLSVLAIQSNSGDVCGVHVGLKIGPERVPARKAGLRALTQHVLMERMLAATREREGLAPLREERTQGADFLADPRWDHVEFIASVTSGRLPQLLSFLGPAIFDATWAEDDVVNAKEVMARLEGRVFGGDSASSKAYHLFRKALVGRSPLARPVFGTEETRGNITMADARSFYTSYYVPNLASVCILSPYPTAEVIDLVTKAFGKYRSRTVTDINITEMMPAGPRVETDLVAGINRAIIVVGVPLPPAGSDGHLIGQIIYAALSGPQGMLATDKTFSSGLPLPARIRAPRAQVIPVSSSRTPYLAAFAQADPTSIDNVRKGILGLLVKLAEEPLSANALKRAKTRAINLNAAEMTAPATAAAVINRQLLLGVERVEQAEFVKRVEAITTEQIQHLAREQLAHHAIGVVMPGA